MRNRVPKKEAAENLHFVFNCSTPRPTSHNKTVVLSMDQNSPHFIENLLAIVHSFNKKSTVTLLYSNTNNEDFPAYYYDVLKVDGYSIPVPVFFSSLNISTRKAFPEDLNCLRNDPEARAVIYEALVQDAFGELTQFKIHQKKAKKNH